MGSDVKLKDDLIREMRSCNDRFINAYWKKRALAAEAERDELRGQPCVEEDIFGCCSMPDCCTQIQRGGHGFGKCVERRTATIDRRRGYEHTYKADSAYYGTTHVRYCIAGNSGPELRTGQRRKA